jgi:hypothetical protein
MRFDDLGDDELLARLMQRGMDPALAASFVRNRDDERTHQIIHEYLEKRR